MRADAIGLHRHRYDAGLVQVFRDGRDLGYVRVESVRGMTVYVAFVTPSAWEEYYAGAYGSLLAAVRAIGKD